MKLLLYVALFVVVCSPVRGFKVQDYDRYTREVRNSISSSAPKGTGQWAPQQVSKALSEPLLCS